MPVWRGAAPLVTLGGAGSGAYSAQADQAVMPPSMMTAPLRPGSLASRTVMGASLTPRELMTSAVVYTMPQL
jgi:hypothetical protein